MKLNLKKQEAKNKEANGYQIKRVAAQDSYTEGESSGMIDGDSEVEKKIRVSLR